MIAALNYGYQPLFSLINRNLSSNPDLQGLPVWLDKSLINEVEASLFGHIPQRQFTAGIVETMDLEMAKRLLWVEKYTVDAICQAFLKNVIGADRNGYFIATFVDVPFSHTLFGLKAFIEQQRDQLSANATPVELFETQLDFDDPLGLRPFWSDLFRKPALLQSNIMCRKGRSRISTLEQC